MLGPNFITLDAESVNQNNPHIERWRVTAFKELNFALIEDCSRYCEEAIDILELPVMGFKSMRDDMRGQIHYRIKYDHMQIGYAVDVKTLQSMPKDIAVRTIAREMAECIGSELCN